MTVEPADRIEMGDAEASALDDELELLERMTIPEGFKAEIVEGAVVVSPQRNTNWDIIDLAPLGFGMRLATDEFPRD